MKRVTAVLEWAVLLPLWRRTFKPKPLQVAFAVGTGIILLLAFVAIAFQGREKDAEPREGANAVPAAQGAVAEAEHVRVILHETTDPWTSEGLFQQSPEGRRIVAFDVTIEFFDNDGTHNANPFHFKLTDANDFAYAEVLRGPEPRLEAVPLESGQKTRGWIAFEVESSTPLKLLRYDPNVLTKKDIEFTFQ